MRTDILLVDSPADIPDPRERFYSYYERQGEMINMGLALLAPFLRARGLVPAILDANQERLSTEQVAESALRSDAGCIGFSLNIYNLASALKIARLLRERRSKCHITAGGVFASCYARELLARFPEFDSIIRGEGEAPLAALGHALKSGGDWRAIEGIVYRDGKKIVSVPRRRPGEAKLDSFAFPDRYDAGGLGGGLVELARGCYGNCSFCCLRSINGISGAPPSRRRDLAAVFDEVEMLLRRGASHVRFQADNFFPSPGAEDSDRFVDEFCRQSRRRRLEFSFSMACRVNDLNAARLKKLRKAGLAGVFIGVESINVTDLARFNKNTTQEEICDAVNLLFKEGMSFDCGYIFFNPWSTPEDLCRSANFMVKVGVHHFPYGAYRMKAHPDTRVFEEIAAEGLLKPRMTFSGENIDALYLRYKFKHAKTGRICEQADLLYREIYSFVLEKALAQCLRANLLQEVKDIADLQVLRYIVRLAAPSGSAGPVAEGTEEAVRAKYRNAALEAITARVGA